MPENTELGSREAAHDSAGREPSYAVANQRHQTCQEHYLLREECTKDNSPRDPKGESDFGLQNCKRKIPVLNQLAPGNLLQQTNNQSSPWCLSLYSRRLLAISVHSKKVKAMQIQVTAHGDLGHRHSDCVHVRYSPPPRKHGSVSRGQCPGIHAQLHQGSRGWGSLEFWLRGREHKDTNTYAHT